MRFWLHRTDAVNAVERLRGRRPLGSGLDPLHERALGFRLGRAVTLTVSRLPTDNRCLMRSLVLTAMLARRRIPSAVVIAARTEPRFEAHAWVEYHGVPLILGGSPGYERLTEV